jgi:uncharacterized cupredoxin-like copper-binding protein
MAAWAQPSSMVRMSVRVFRFVAARGGFQWRLCSSLGGGCTDVLGQTAQTYVVTAADVGNTLDVLVTASNTAGSSSSVSATSAKISAAPSTTTTTTATAVTVTAGAPMEYSFTLSALGQTVYSDKTKQLTVPAGSVTFTVTNALGIGNHDFFVCSTPLTGSAIKTATINLPQTCTGTGTTSLAPGDGATLTVELSKGTYEYLSNVGCPTFCDSGDGMIGKLQVT